MALLIAQRFIGYLMQSTKLWIVFGSGLLILVSALRPVGGCFADQYHGQSGISPADKCPAIVNFAWGDVVDSSVFGTDELMKFTHRISSNIQFLRETLQIHVAMDEFMAGRSSHG